MTSTLLNSPPKDTRLRKKRRRNGEIHESSDSESGDSPKKKNQPNFQQKGLQTPVVDKRKVQYIPPEKQTIVDTQEQKRREKVAKELPHEVPMGVRLKQITVKQQRLIDKRKRTTGDEIEEGAISKVVLLSQALHSQDAAKLETLFQISNEEVIRKTISELPSPLIATLFTELRKRIADCIECRYLRWMQILVSLHMAFLTSVPELRVELGSLRTYLSSSLAPVDKLLQLQGKLRLLVVQAQRRQPQTEMTEAPPQLLFQEESSDSDVEVEEESMGGLSGEDDLDDWWGEVEGEEETTKESEEEQQEEEEEEEDSDAESDPRKKSSEEPEDFGDFGGEEDSDDD